MCQFCAMCIIDGKLICRQSDHGEESGTRECLVKPAAHPPISASTQELSGYFQAFQFFISCLIAIWLSPKSYSSDWHIGVRHESHWSLAHHVRSADGLRQDDADAASGTQLQIRGKLGKQLQTRSSCSTAPSSRCLSLTMTSLQQVIIVIVKNWMKNNFWSNF